MSFQGYYWLLVPIQGRQPSVLHRHPQFAEAAEPSEPLRQSHLFLALADFATGVVKVWKAWKQEQEIIRKKGLRRAALLNRDIS